MRRTLLHDNYDDRLICQQSPTWKNTGKSLDSLRSKINRRYFTRDTENHNENVFISPQLIYISQKQFTCQITTKTKTINRIICSFLSSTSIYPNFWTTNQFTNSKCLSVCVFFLLSISEKYWPIHTLVAESFVVPEPSLASSLAHINPKTT